MFFISRRDLNKSPLKHRRTPPLCRLLEFPIENTFSSITHKLLNKIENLFKGNHISIGMSFGCSVAAICDYHGDKTVCFLQTVAINLPRRTMLTGSKKGVNMG